MSLTRTTADAALKDFYLPMVRNVLNNEVFLLSQVEQNSEDVEGRRAVLSINTNRNHGVGARAELGSLPTAGQQGYSEERVGLKYNYGRIQISGPTIRSMGSDRGSFTRAVQSETQGVVRDLKNDVNRQLFGTSNGVIATCGVTSAATLLVLDSATPLSAMRQLMIGMEIDIGTVANTDSVSVTKRTIEVVNVAARTIEISGAAVTTAATDFVFRHDAGGADGGEGQKELTGLQTQINDTGALWNIDPAVVPNWASFVNDNSGTPRAVSEDMFIEADQEVNIASGEQINLWITSAGVSRNTAALFTALRQFNTPTELPGGYRGLNMSSISQGQTGANTVSMMWDKDCPDGTAFGLTTKRMQNYRMSDWEFMDEDGAVLNRVAGVDAYEATLFNYMECATDARNAHARINDLTS
jgi:hypothetical protein